MKNEQTLILDNEIDWTPELQEQFIAAIDEPEELSKFAAFKSKIKSLKDRFVTWFKTLPTWQKVLLILAALAALGLITWWIVSISGGAAAASGVHGAGSLYAMADGNAVKLGLTGRAPLTRAAEIARYAPGTKLIGSINVPNMLAAEQLAHNHFAPLKYASYLGSREWFDIGPRMAMNYLNRMAIA